VHAPLFLGYTDWDGSIGFFVGAGRSKFTPDLPPHSTASRIQLAYLSYVPQVSQHNNPTVSMLFSCISFCLLRSCRPFDCAVKLAYKKYIQWKRYDCDVNSICHGLDSLHWQCDKRHIKMDAELELICGALNVMTRLYDTS
jgi:hypothetical protein